MSKQSRKLFLTPQGRDGFRSNIKQESLAKRYRKHPQGNLAEQIAYQEEEGRQGQRESNQPSLLPQDSLASLSVSLGSEEARQTTATSGLKLSQLLKPSSPDGYCLKMLLESSTWHSTLCYLTWKVRATPMKRLLFQLAPSTPHTDETEFGLWPSPKATEWKGASTPGQHGHQGMYLTGAVKMWPTPREGNPGSRPNQKGGKILAEEVMKSLLPTPTLRDFKGESRRAKYGVVDYLPDAVIYQNGKPIGGQLNPNWVEWLMGFPIGWTDLNV